MPNLDFTGLQKASPVRDRVRRLGKYYCDSKTLAGLTHTDKDWGVSFVRADAYLPFGTTLTPQRRDGQFSVTMPFFIDHEIR